MERIIAVTNQKGGVGKTTSVIHIAEGLSGSRKVLTIDLDPQGHYTKGLGIDTTNRKTIYEILRSNEEHLIKDAIVHYDGYDVIPTDLRLCNAEMELYAIPGRELLLRNALEEIAGNYDYILMDCPPSLSVLTLNALVASTEMVVALQPEVAALDGVSMLLKTIGDLNRVMKTNVNVSGVIITMYKSQTVLHKQIASSAEVYFGDKVYKSRIRQTIDIPTAFSQQQSVYKWKPSSSGAEDYRSLCREIIEQEG